MPTIYTHHSGGSLVHKHRIWRGERKTRYKVYLNWPECSVSVPCVYLFHSVMATEFDYGITIGSEYCMQLIV